MEIAFSRQDRGESREVQMDTVIWRQKVGNRERTEIKCPSPASGFLLCKRMWMREEGEGNFRLQRWTKSDQGIGREGLRPRTVK